MIIELVLHMPELYNHNIHFTPVFIEGKRIGYIDSVISEEGPGFYKCKVEVLDKHKEFVENEIL